MGIGISRNYMVGFEGLWTHNNFSEPTIDFLEMPTTMGESLYHFMRLDVRLVKVWTIFAEIV